ncbi:hypothetical protein [Neolewinella litorea]|uniref:Uncharacterized protein n=1 Tax=Neolewinella litorea TaxID=2562452 RepID=A0A4S4NPW0_9BACT|nr:hypothetical protein [Neolewinella litorea]THH40441.1 hypothetical protein E4021_06810 [Neolewinella litorea]
MRLFTTTLLLALLCLASCGPKVYEAPNMASVSRSHQLIAIVPPSVAIKGRPKDDQAQLEAAAREDTYTFQREIYSWMLRRKQQGKIRGLEIMDPETTNTKLERAG